MLSEQCAIYVRPANEYHISKDWGGAHITMAGFQSIPHEVALKKIKKIAKNHFSHGHAWHPFDYEVVKWKSGWTVKIKSQTLSHIASELKKSHFHKVKGPNDAGVAFHVTMPKYIKDKNAAKKYAKSLANREWFLTVAEKTGPKQCQWHNHKIPIKK